MDVPSAGTGWPTARRGRVLIHAARVPDDRAEAWRQVPPDVEAIAQLQGGIIGAAELTECRRYGDLKTFMVDQAAHYNEAGWFDRVPIERAMHLLIQKGAAAYDPLPPQEEKP